MLGLRRMPQEGRVWVCPEAEVAANCAGEEVRATRDCASTAHHGLLEGEREDDETQEGIVAGGQGNRRKATKIAKVGLFINLHFPRTRVVSHLTHFQ